MQHRAADAIPPSAAATAFPYVAPLMQGSAGCLQALLFGISVAVGLTPEMLPVRSSGCSAVLVACRQPADWCAMRSTKQLPCAAADGRQCQPGSRRK